MIVRKTTKYKKDVKRLKKRNYDLSLLANVISKIASGEKLEPSYCDHALNGDYQSNRECHIKPDWLLVYYIDENELILLLMRTGTHSDLFKK